MPEGVHIFELLERYAIRPSVAKAAAQISKDRWWYLQHGIVPWREKEVLALESLLAPHGVTRADMFDNLADENVLLPPNRLRARRRQVAA